MKPSLFVVLLGIGWLTNCLCAGPRDAQWAKVDAAQRGGLPKTAIELLEPIIAGARSDGAHAELVKAVTRKIALEAGLQGGRAEEKITHLEAELVKAPAETKPLMQALLAQWYWQYFQQNRWRFLQRTRTAEEPGADPRTWDLPRIVATIDRHFSAALADEARLQAAQIFEYDDLLPRGSVADVYRPTLFDFIAYQALSFYQAGEQGVPLPEHEFEVDAVGSPIFAEPAEFLAWQPSTVDESAPRFKAVRLLQKLMAFHRDDADRSAFLDADLARLKFGHNQAFGADVAERYKVALQRFATAAADHESSARALAALATLLNAEGDPAKALALARRGFEAFPDYAGGAMCRNLILQIERKHLEIATERVWNAPWPTLDVTYRNLAKVYFRAVKMDFSARVSRTRWDIGANAADEHQMLVDATPSLAWTADLPATLDYRQRTERLPVPTSLAPGYYVILASPSDSFSGTEGPVTTAEVWVSSLALVTHVRRDAGAQGGFVLNARTGEPIDGAFVRTWHADRNGYFHPGPGTHTDVDGRFKVEPGESAVILHAEHRGQAAASSHAVRFGREREDEAAGAQTMFFTDRAIYRPGQTISYKGISFRVDWDAGTYATLARRKVTVVFNDPNGKEIARASHTTNDYGSFSGVFTAPRDRLPGSMMLHALEPHGSTTFNVEDYKRPKFRVELDAPAEAPKLDAPVDLTGTAVAYTGAAIGGARVTWRVERRARLPAWCWWFQPPAMKAIAHGSSVAAADGSFKIRFTAAPDRSVPVANEPVFTYTVFADVTDTTGETRSAERALSAGYTALQASVTAAEWQTSRQPVDFTIETTTLDGKPQAADGTWVVHALRQPTSVQRAAIAQLYHTRKSDRAHPDASDPETWESGAEVARRPFVTAADGRTRLSQALKPGIYRASLETQDRFGRKVTARHTVRVLAPNDRHFGIRVPQVFTAPKWSVQPGETFTALWGTGYEAGRAFIEVECNGKLLQSTWTPLRRTQAIIEQEVTEAMRGGFHVRVTYVRENRIYVSEHLVNVPWSNKQLAITWESFRSKLLPGQKETWTAVLSGPEARRAAGEMVAGLYDASLDHFLPHSWPRGFNAFRADFPRQYSEFHNSLLNFRGLIGSWDTSVPWPVNWAYRSFPGEVVASSQGWSYVTGSSMEGVLQLSAFSVNSDARGYVAAGLSANTGASQNRLTTGGGMTAMAGDGAPDPESAGRPLPDLGKIAARKNLSETAFFFPHVLAGRNGQLKLTFTMPEALTEWRFFGFAHDKQLRAGFIEATTVTAKDLMVQPNPPRFVREGDRIEFTVKVSNQSDRPQSGKVRLTFADAATQQSVDAALGHSETDQAFTLPPKQSRSLSWRIAVPDGMGFLTFKAVGTTEKLSDGEEGFMPVLSRRILVTESLPLPVRGQGTREFEFAKLTGSAASPTLRHQSLSVQMVSQPAWYAVLALPYLMEFPHECSEQIFNRLYANALARHIAGSDPKIRQIFEQWKNTPVLDSPLEKNADLKSVMLEETPWLRQAAQESAARRNVGLLFDANRLDEETARGLQALAERQLNDGLWPWFPGGRSSEFISLYITTGFGRLRHLGGAVDMTSALKSLANLDRWIDVRCQRITDRQHYVPSSLDALYLYGRSFFLNDRALTPVHRESVDYLLAQARTFWRQVGDRQSQAHLALALQRFGDKATAGAIMQSIKERSVTDDELGRFWRDQELSWWWYRAPIETQALMIEAFAEVTGDTQAVEDCQTWLLKQKQVQGWKTTKATADAVYALLLRGRNLLASDARVEVALGGVPVRPERTEAGTGFYERKFTAAEITPAMGRISVTKPDAGVSWGSVHWQYLEDVGKITAHTATPLTLRKTLFIRENSAKGPVLRPVTGPVAVGDELIVRLELRSDRDMEYLHLKDQRGSGTEPVNVLSRYKYQDGFGYYESTRDTASHFFIDYLPRGTHVFEYATRVQLKGQYQTGLAEIQCMYAPEFNSHSESIALEVR